MSRTCRTVLALAAGTVLTVLGVVAPAASAQAAPASLGGDFCRLVQNGSVAFGTPIGGTCPD
ncbi:hypothetical protein [Streptomyces roseifaciens]|uniref:hypothetical protein n=1 Tax=Streptomyces roseifaciens TaxID=1488406 RepID=UPI000B2C3B17|nr:hypothetical protein [Streptomyces roseifaciens]